jgi:predicted dehydrogenase
MKPKIGLVGTGQTVGIAHYHVKGILADSRAEIAAVYDVNHEGAKTFMNNHGLNNAVLCSSYAQLLDLVDAVDICTPNFTHIDYVLNAIVANKSIFVEKPLALTTEESRKAVMALDGKNLFHMVGFVYRYSAVMQRLRELIHNDIGQVYTYQASFGGCRLANPANPIEWRMLRNQSGSGALGDFGSHLIDNAAFVAGLKFDSVSCLSTTNIPVRPANKDGKTEVENDDQSVFIAKSMNNALASFTVSRIGMDELNLVISGQGGIARVNLARPDCIHYLPANKGLYQSSVSQIELPYQKPFEDWFVGEMKAFVDGLLGSKQPVPDIYQGHYVEAVIEAAEKSSRNNQVKVTI